MHAGVEFEMDGIGGVDALEVIGEEVEDAEGVDVGFEVVADDVVEGRGFRVHDHDGEGYAAAAEGDAFVGVGDGEVVDVVVLECGGDLDGTGTVGGGFDHGHESCAGVEA